MLRRPSLRSRRCRSCGAARREVGTTNLTSLTNEAIGQLLSHLCPFPASGLWSVQSLVHGGWWRIAFQSTYRQSSTATEKCSTAPPCFPDLQKLLARLGEADLLERSESAEVRRWEQAARGITAAKKAPTNGQNYEDWRADHHHPGRRGLGALLRLRAVPGRQPAHGPAQDRRAGRAAPAGPRRTRAVLPAQPTQPTATTCCASSTIWPSCPATKDVFGKHNPIRELPNWLSGDAARELLEFFQKIDAEHRQRSSTISPTRNWDTRFLGDLYQDLSEAARKKYALLQTPEFVEEFILDRTLDPAIEEFGLDKMGLRRGSCPSGGRVATTASA